MHETRQHLPALDGFRGVAAVIVVVSHAANASMLPDVFGRGFGQMGVSAFYLLSGFLMGYLYLNKACSPENLKEYLINRLARVLPLFYVLLLTAVALNAVTTFNFYRMNDLASFAGNLFLYRGTSVFWSIPVEIHFYFLFLILWTASARRASGMMIFFFFLAEGALWLLSSREVINPWRESILFWLHMFLIGLLISKADPEKLTNLLGAERKRLIFLLSVLAILVFPLILPELRRSMGIRVLPPFYDPLLVGYPVLLLSLALSGSTVFAFLTNTVFRWLGSVSFGLYLIHQPIIDIVKRIDVVPPFAGFEFLLVMSVSLLLAQAARRAIEIPAMRLLRRTKVPRLQLTS